jgi:hypothetical protein
LSAVFDRQRGEVVFQARLFATLPRLLELPQRIGHGHRHRQKR